MPVQWPFKHLKQGSSWPFQPFAVQFAAAVLQAPSSEKKTAARKMIERCVRLGARLACEFDMPPVVFVEVAKAMIIKEGGKAAQASLSEAFGDEVIKAVDASEEAVDAIQAQVAAAFNSGDDTPEA